MRNTRALKLKAGAEEFDSKKSDIKRLTHGLQAFATVALHKTEVCGKIEVNIARYRGSMIRVVVRMESSNVVLRYFVAGRRIYNEADFDLEIVRLVYDNMDAVIDAVEMFCSDAERQPEFLAQLARFE